MSYTFDSFNARNIRAQDVAKTFVDSEDFRLVKKNCHSILLGPRGSGKTTLLKMLTLPAIDSWNRLHENSPVSLPFTSIYIPSDIVWHHQLMIPGQIGLDSSPFFSRTSNAAVVTAIMIATVDTFMDKLQYEASLLEGDETAFCETLIKGWSLEYTIPKLSQIYLALHVRMMQLGALLNRATTFAKPQDLEKELPSWCDVDFINIVDYAVAAFDFAFNQDRQNRWALCFDELELAPDWLQTRMFNFPRSTNQKLIFKLSSSPDPEIFVPPHVTPSDDVEIMLLWRSSIQDRKIFCRELAQSVMRRNNVNEITPEDFLGLSDREDFDDNTPISTKAYEEGSPEYELIRSVASWDTTLAALLRKKHIDPNHPIPESTAQKDTVFRKIKPIVALRNEYTKVRADGAVVRRSRKSGLLYCGLPSIYNISDGNPRRLMKLFEDLCAHAQIDELGNVRQLSPETQARVIMTSANLFRDYVRMIPGAQITLENGYDTIALYNLLKVIGYHLSFNLLLKPFSLDPVNSFTVDDDTDEHILKLLRIASYHGAILKVDNDNVPSNDIRGCRFRLCFALSPLFRLPLRLYAATKLSSCLENRPVYVRKGAPSIARQLNLGINP